MVPLRTVIGQTVVIGAVTGTAAWTTLGVLDATTASGRAVRLALLPSASVWLALVLAATSTVALTLWAATWWTGRRTDSVLRCAHPLTSSAVLVVPYLPWLADVFPVLTALAGPGRWIVWWVILAAVTARVARLFRSARPDPRLLTPATTVGLVIVVGALVSGYGAARLARTSVYPSGDEPHYLVMAQSLWRDGDLAIENNHARGDYREYFTDFELAPHYLTRGTDGEIYSVHPVGLPVLLAPAYALGGYAGVRAVLILVAATAGGVLLWWLHRLGLPRSAALASWAGVCLTAPFYFFSFAVFPETVAGLLVTVGVMMAVGPGWSRHRKESSPATRWLVVGAAAGLLPWMSSKYAPMAAAVVAVALARIWTDGRPVRARVTQSLWLLGPFGLSLLSWLAFFVAYWGTPWPGAPYGGDPQLHPRRLPVGVPGLIFDQEYGVLAYAPVYLLVGPGLAVMWRVNAATRRLAVEVGLVVLALWATVGAFHIWWGGSAPPGRPVVSVLPLLGVPLAYSMRETGNRWVHRGLLTLSLGLSATLLLAQDGLLLHNLRDGTSSLLVYLSPLWPLSSVAPSFMTDVPRVALAIAGVWLATGWGVVRVLHRVGSGSLRATTQSMAVVVSGLLVVTAAVPVLSARPAGRLGPESRARSALLDRYDASRLPLGIVLDPVRRLEVQALPSRVRLWIRPDSTGAAGEPDLLYGRRLSLPAGRYRVTMSLSGADRPRAGTLALRVGRLGAPLEAWEIRVTPNQPWTAEVTLDHDGDYIGLEASPELEAARPEVVIRPLQVVDAGARRKLPQVTATLRTTTASFYFLDDNIWLEPRRFWTKGGRAARFLMAPASPETAATEVRLTVRCGPVLNTVVLESEGAREVVTLAAGARHRVAVPLRHRSAVLTVAASDGFTPSSLVERSTDTRRLGCQLDDIEWLP